MPWEEIIKAPLLTKLGGGAVALGSILTYFWKVKPITALTSTNIERVLLSKESRTSINILRYILQSFAISIASTYLVFSFWLLKITTVVANVITVVSILLVIIILIEAKTKNSLVHHFLKSPKKRKITSAFLLCASFTFLFSIAPAYLTKIFDDHKISSYNPIELIEIFILLDLLLIIFPLLYLFLLKDTAKAILREYQRFNGEYFYLKDEEDVKWYIYHPLEKNQFLLGDKSDSDEASIFKILEKSEIIKQKICVEKVPNN